MVTTTHQNISAGNCLSHLKKIQDWILKPERIRKRILRFFTKQINPRSLGSWCVKGTKESIFRVDSLVPLMHHESGDLGLICLVKKRKIRFRILSDLGFSYRDALLSPDIQCNLSRNLSRNLFENGVTT